MTPSRAEIAVALGEMVRLQTGLLAHLRNANMIGVDQGEVDRIAQRVKCLTAAHLQFIRPATRTGRRAA